MFEKFPKKGKKSSRPGTKEVKWEEKTGSPYFFRHEKGEEEKRMREVFDNNYGKADKATRPEKTTDGFPVSPRRTIITGS